MADSTIIIPTYNRPAHLKRIIGYYDGFGKNYRVIVADSSRDEQKRANRDVVSSVSNLHILYLNSYSSEIHPLDKFADALTYVDTEYCAFCADDDFVVPNGIRASVAFLEKNPDYIVAQGRFISFKILASRKGKRRFRWDFADDPLSIGFEDPGARFERQLGDYSTGTFYGVHRSDILKTVFQEVVKSQADPFMFTELLATSLTLIYGKMKYVDVFYGARSGQTYGSGPGWPTVKDAIKDGTYDEKYPKFRDCLAAHLSQNSRLNIEEAGKLVDKAMNAYLTKFIAAEILGLPKSRKRAFLDSLHLPEGMYNKILRSYSVSYQAVKAFSLYETLIAKLTFPRSRYRDDFDKIRQCVLSNAEAASSEFR